MVLVVDSALQLEPPTVKELGVEVAEYPLFLNGEEYPVSMDMSREAKDKLRLLLKDKDNKVTTSGLREEDLREIYLRHKGEKIISLHQSSKASTATIAVINKLLTEFEDLDIVHIDAQHLTGAYSVIVQQAGEALNRGMEYEELKEYILRTRANTRHLGVVYDLFYLHRTGRIGLAKAVMGTAMKIIALLGSSEQPGVLKSIGKVKNYTQANQRFIKMICEDMAANKGTALRAVLSVIGPHEKEAAHLKALLEEQDFKVHAEIHYTNHSNMPHAGPDFYDIGYTILQDDKEF
ncbi:DegV family protein [Oceanispirochaeta sp.]|jgi:DegV family protein with EDD domain|uniref:DegV family protein n=1 Tax=Oceanispirochaeta sp. TaxID=2035350 RepID=UPI00263306A5|nr:DegV family protein [Oceanispirochaeta sp.]MDA3957359.1 DegV family EDD domain-containing protein [Oceanispirochaeta sp.]